VTARTPVEARIRERLAALDPASVDLADESAAHAGHAGARDGGHWRVVIVSPQFAGKSRVARHRLVYDAMGDLMRGTIHALAIEAFAPDER